MRYSPYAEEVIDIATMNEAQLLEYFLTRVFETEEVWGLDDGCEWIVTDNPAQSLMPIWPYRQLAEDAARQQWSGYTATAESLEDFVYQTLGELMEDDIILEIMPAPDKAGCKITPHRLFEIFTGMFNAGEYTLDS